MTRHAMGQWTHTHITTVDEWAAEHLIPADEAPLTAQELQEAEWLIHTLPLILGETAAEVTALLRTLIHRGDGGAARVVLNWLRDPAGLLG